MTDNLEATFEKAAAFARTRIGSMTPEQVLCLYGLYKQATEGHNKAPKPNFWNVTAKQKWEAWAKHSLKSPQIAMEQYIAAVAAMDPEWEEQPVSWVRHSTLFQDELALPECEQDLFYWVKENNVAACKKSLAAGADINKTDLEGLSLLHWAADRGHCEMLKILLQAGVPCDVQDAEGQTALHYAASCGHEDAIAMLLRHGADPNVIDVDGSKPCDVAATPQIAQLLVT